MEHKDLPVTVIKRVEAKHTLDRIKLPCDTYDYTPPKVANIDGNTLDNIEKKVKKK